MKKLSLLSKIIIPVVTLMVGLIIGLGIGQAQIKKEQRIFQDKIREANKKIAFVQKRMADEKTEATLSVEQKCQNDLERLQTEKKVLGDQLGKLKEETRNLQAKIEAEEEASAKTKKELQEEKQKYAQALQHSRDLERDQAKMTAEKQAVQTELEKTTRTVGRCEVNNAKLCLIAEELLKAYMNKGIGAALLQKEPLTEIKKVELEQLSETYRKEIEQQRIKKK